jgi:spore germination cell wall hydrolase CwlJ-like protein
MIRLPITVFVISFLLFYFFGFTKIEDSQPQQRNYVVGKVEYEILEVPKKVKTTKHTLTTYDEKQIRCLAKNVYFEARGEPRLGQVAVAFVTLNRVESRHFPNTVCGVVEERRRHICQFSWYCESQPRYIYNNNILTLRDDPVYNDIVERIRGVYVDYKKISDPTRGSLFYHADYVDVSKIGVRNLSLETKIGRHIFYTLNNT